MKSHIKLLQNELWHVKLYIQEPNVCFNNFVKQEVKLKTKVKVTELRSIALFVVNGSIKKLLLIDFVDIYLFSIFFSIVFVNIYDFSIFFSIDFAQWKNVGPSHNANIVIH